MEQSFIEYSLGKDASSAVLWVYPVRKPRGKAIIMCPGGGFNQIASDHEGHDFAAWFNNQGITYAVLNYRMPHGDVEVIREDIREAIRLIRRQSASTGCYGSFYRRLYRCYCRNSLYRNRPARLSSIALSRYQHDRQADSLAFTRTYVGRNYLRRFERNTIP